ncbi:MAG: TrkH family potassium uptake protein [Rickettsiales bacterium]|nr:TrkH family potassium uptake protein [Rickettsiales bacterium]
MFEMRPILLVNGILLGLLSLIMLIPLMLDLALLNEDWKVFGMSSFITGFVGGILFLTNRGYRSTMTIRQAFIFTTFTYVIMSIFASLPLYLSELDLSLADAYFESTSGITATGATVLVGLDRMPPGLLLWRSLLNAMGGIGIVVLAMALLPMLRIGGMQLFRTESSETMDKVLPRAPQIAAVISGVFISLMLICAFCYWLAGMSGFDAINHALTTIATGGFSTHDASIGHFRNPAIEWIAIIFMISGALPIILYYQMMKGKASALLQNAQVKGFFIIVGLATLVLAGWLIIEKSTGFIDALRMAMFNVVAVVTTTGYSSVDYGNWGTFATCIFFMLIVVGGCTGSTSGGIKIFRIQVLFETAKAQVHQLIHPHGVFIPRYHGKPITDQISNSVMSFIICFALCFTFLAVALSFYGLDFLTAMSASAQALANVGPGLGDIIGPAGNYSTLPDGPKWMLAFAMIMGRVELFTVLVLFTPSFWRD